MSFAPRQAVLLFGVVALGGAVPPAQAQRMGRYTLNPKTYKSPSGEYELRVDPSTIYGQGEGSYRMTRKGAEIWAKKLPFTLWDAAVADDGTTAGYAYSLGMENYPLDRNKPENGKLHLLIFDPKGELRRNEILPRHGTFTCLTTVDNNVTGMILDPDNDRFIVRCREVGLFADGESWWVYRLSTGRLQDEFDLAHPEEGAREYSRVLAARPVAGTPLVLVNWVYERLDDDGNAQGASSGCFMLIGAVGKPVWELDRPDDYPNWSSEHSESLGEKERKEYDEQLNLEEWISSEGAILDTGQPGQFELWFVQESQRVTFSVEKEGSDGWRVTEEARAHHRPAVPPDPDTQADKLDALSLEHLGTIELKVDTAAAPEIRDIQCFDVDDRGRIGFVRGEPYHPGTFLLVESNGGIVRKVSLNDLFDNGYSNPDTVWVGGDRWLMVASNVKATRAWWLDVGSGALAEIEAFAGQGAHQVAATGDGGFVATIEPPSGSKQPEAIAAFDREGKQRWRSLPPADERSFSGTRGITVTTDGRVVVGRDYGRLLTFFTANGEYLQTTRCEQLSGKKWSYAHWVSADLDGGLVVVTDDSTGRVFRARRDWSIQTSCTVKHPDGRPVDLAWYPGHFGIRATRDGTLWACDRHSLLRLNPAGVVDRVLGEAPDSPELRRIGGVAIDQQGNTYLAEERNGITHVFDSSGTRVRMLRPNPDDFERGGKFSIDVAGDGSVFVNGLQFSPRGERVGFRQLPSNVDDQDVLDRRVRSQPHGRRYWMISQEAVTLVGEGDNILQTIRRRPDRNWLDNVEASAVAPDGSLAVIAGSSSLVPYWKRERHTVNLYSPSGAPLKTIELPSIGESQPMWGEQFAFNGRYVLVEVVGEEDSRYLLLDSAANPPKWYDLPALEAYSNTWHYFFVKDGQELWMFAEGARKVERFGVPTAGPQTSPARQPAQTQPVTDGGKDPVPPIVYSRRYRDRRLTVCRFPNGWTARFQSYRSSGRAMRSRFVPARSGVH